MLILDDYSKYKWSHFIQKKSNIATIVMLLLLELSAKKYKVISLCIDMAGENKELAAKTKEKGLKIKMTVPHMPQMNGVAERAFAVCAISGRAMMKAANLPNNL